MNDFNIILMAKDGDKAALEKIVKENEGLVWSVVRRFLNRGYDAQDLFQTGSIGLLKAVRKFDVSYGVQFSTYAVPLIMGEIKRFLRDDGMIKVSRRYKELTTRANAVRERLLSELMREPTLGEIADALGVDSAEITVAAEACSSWDSIYKTVCEGDKNDVYLIDKLSNDDNGEDILDMVSLKSAFESLTDREKIIIKMRYFMDKTQCQVAKRLGISQVQVSRIEKKVLSRLKEDMKECV